MCAAVAWRVTILAPWGCDLRLRFAVCQCSFWGTTPFPARIVSMVGRRTISGGSVAFRSLRAVEHLRFFIFQIGDFFPFHLDISLSIKSGSKVRACGHTDTHR